MKKLFYFFIMAIAMIISGCDFEKTPQPLTTKEIESTKKELEIVSLRLKQNREKRKELVIDFTQCHTELCQKITENKLKKFLDRESLRSLKLIVRYQSDSLLVFKKRIYNDSVHVSRLNSKLLNNASISQTKIKHP